MLEGEDMRRVISVLLILMQLLFFINYFINEDIMQFNLYLWIFTAVFGVLLSIRSWRNGAYLYESELLYKITYISLSIVSGASIIFNLFLIFTRPHLL